MKRKVEKLSCFTILAAMIFLLFAAGCQKSNDRPPKMEGPEPEAHKGVFVSANTIFTFPGDEERVFVEFDEEYLKALGSPPNKTYYSYAFTWYEFGQCRYDAATNLKLYHPESGTNIDFSINGKASADRISIYDTHAGNVKLELTKKE